MPTKRACAVVDLPRSLYYYHIKKPKNEVDRNLVSRILVIRQRHQTIGAKKLAKMLSTKESPINHKRIARVLKTNNLVVVRKRRIRRRHESVERLPLPTQVEKNNDVWSLDFMCARKSNTFKFMLLNVVDVRSRVSPLMKVERSFTSFDVTDELDKIMEIQGRPRGLITDNGAEFTSGHFRVWCRRNKITHYLTNKGRPAENCFVESFNSCVRREVLDSNDFQTMNELRNKIESWRNYYNTERPHGSLGYETPEKYYSLEQNQELAV